MEGRKLRILLVEDREDDAAPIELPIIAEHNPPRVRKGNLARLFPAMERALRPALAEPRLDYLQGLGIHRREPLAGVPVTAARRA